MGYKVYNFLWKLAMLNLKALMVAIFVSVLTPILQIHFLSESKVLAQTQEERKAEADRFLQQRIMTLS